MIPRVTGSMEPEICTKKVRNLSEKLAAKFPATTLHGKNVFSEIFELEVSPV